MAIKGDPFHREPSSARGQVIDEVKRHYEDLWVQLTKLESDVGPSRDLSVAYTHLQTSCMWAVRHITKMPGQE